MAETRNIMFKLQTALKQKGVLVPINTYQFYSEDKKRFIKMYEAKYNGKVLEKSASQIKIINALKTLLDEVRESEEK